LLKKNKKDKGKLKNKEKRNLKDLERCKNKKRLVKQLKKRREKMQKML
jgi:hypothetical protein